MKIIKLIYISIIIQCITLPFVCAQDSASVSSDSEEARKIKADLEARYETWANQPRDEYSPQWNDGLTGMNAQATILIGENERLANERQSLEEEWASLQSEIQKKNEQSQALKENMVHQQDSTDDKDLSTQLDEWKEKSKQKNQELEERKRRVEALDKKIKLVKMKLATQGVDFAPISDMLKTQTEVEDLQAQWQQAFDQEQTLKHKIEEAKSAEPKLNPAAVTIKTEIDALKLEIADAKSGKRAAPKAAPQPTAAELTQKRDHLKQEIQHIKSEIDRIQNAQKMGISNQRVKKLVEEMSAIDKQNNNLREEISTLKDNIAVLQSHVTKLDSQGTVPLAP